MSGEQKTLGVRLVRLVRLVLRLQKKAMANLTNNLEIL